MSEHERCAGCGEEAIKHTPFDEFVGCRLCAWRAPNWEQWDRVMRSVRVLNLLVREVEWSPYAPLPGSLVLSDAVKASSPEEVIDLFASKEAPDA